MFTALAAAASVFLFSAQRIAHAAGYPLHKQSFVVPLTDENFEHETQASTGGTTGSWMVWFHGPRDETPIAGEIPEPDFWAEHHIVLASVDGTKNPATRLRFEVAKLPAFIYIHKGKYYRLDKPDEGYVFNWDKIEYFLIELYETTGEYDIPPPRTFKDDVMDLIEKAKREFGGVYIQAMGAFFGFLTLLAIINKLFIDKPSPKKKQ